MARRRTDLLVSACILVCVVGGMVVWKQFFGAAVGEECANGRDCRRIGSRCLVTPVGNYCTRGCTLDADCPSGWRCAEAAWRSRKSGESTGDVERLCMRPVILRPPPPR
jgi:hypothetical protein